MNVKALLKYALKKPAKNQTFQGCSLFFSGLLSNHWRRGSIPETSGPFANLFQRIF